MPTPTPKRSAKRLPLSRVVAALESIAPPHLAEPWDQVGLQVGRWDQAVTAGLLCIDFTPAVLDEVLERKCDFVVAYHPPMFKPLARLTGGQRWPDPSDPHRRDDDWKQGLLLETARGQVAVYSPHTALDAVRGGLNDWLCDGLGAASVRFSIGRREVPNAVRKVVVFVPRGQPADRVRQAMADAGAGCIGRYDHCSFNVDGTGTFRGDEGTNPAIGKPGQLETVDETRIEMACWPNQLGEVLRAIRQAHPYEEPAIDVFASAPLAEPEDEEQGAGRVHHLKTPVTPETLARRVKKRLGLKHVKLARPTAFVGEAGVEGKVSSVAVCVGSGGSLFETYPNADAYLTGEMQHHQVLDLVQRGKVVILAGHTNTERPFLPRYREMIEDTDAGKLSWQVSAADVTPWVYA